jgi:hypothetical protein
MSAFDHLAEYGASKLPGIDWTALASKGKPGIWNSDYFYDYMIPAWEAVDGIRDSLQLSNAADTAALMAGFKSASKPVISCAGDMLAALAAGRSVVAAERALSLGTEELRATVTAMYYTALDGMIVHRYLLLQKHGAEVIQQGSSPEFVDRYIEDHADRVTRTLRGITALDDLGVLSFIKKPGLSGPEIVPISGGVLVTLVAVAAIIAAAMVYVIYISERNLAAFIQCKKAHDEGDQEVWKACVDANLKDPAGAGSLPYELATKILMYLAAAGAIYLGITFLPEIVTSLKKARTASRST